jgi:acyl-CoA thioesterase-1
MRFGRSFLLAAHLLVIAGAASDASAASAAAPVVTILGDSITAGYGLPADQALPAQIQQAVARLGTAIDVRASGVSGDTAEGGLARVDFSVAPDTALCIIELGANDYLQSIPPDETRASLTGIIDQLKRRHIRVLLFGGHVPRRSAGDYAAAFNAIFPALAQSEHVVLEPDFLAGVQGNPALHQQDGIHPNAAGVRLMADRIAPYVVEALK